MSLERILEFDAPARTGVGYAAGFLELVAELADMRQRASAQLEASR